MSTAPAFLRRSRDNLGDHVEKLGNAIETELAEMRHRAALPPPLPVAATPSHPLPEYVTPKEDTPEAGRMSAQAMAAEFDKTAKEVDLMGNELKLSAERGEAMIQQIYAIITYVRETAEYYRDEAKKIHDQIETASITAEEVRRQCALMRGLIANPPVARTTTETETKDEAGETTDA